MDIGFYITNITYALLGILNLMLIWRIAEFFTIYLKNITICDLKKRTNILFLLHIFFALYLSIFAEYYIFKKYNEITASMINTKHMILHIIGIILYTSIFQKINKYMCYKMKNSMQVKKTTLMKDEYYIDEKTLRNIVLLSNEGDKCTFSYDIDKEEISANSKVESIIGYSKDELKDIKLTNIVSKIQIGRLKKFCSQKKHSYSINTIIDVRRKDGQIIIVSIIGAIIINKEKRILKAAVRNVTEKIGVEIDVLKINILLKEIVQNLEGYSLFVVDKTYRYLLINESYKNLGKEILGIDISLGMNHLDILDMNKEKILLYGLKDLSIKNLEKALSGNSSKDIIEISKITGKKEYWDVHYICLRENDEIIGAGVLIVDITEKQNRRKEIIEANKKATAANRAKSQFLANMSHEIRTPMNGIIGLIDLMLKTELNEEQVKMMNTAKDAASILLDIINDILDFSKIESGKFKIIYKPFNFYQLINEIKNVFFVKKNQKNIHIEYDIDKGINTYLIGDKLRLKQILINLIGNAFKFTEKGKIIVRVQREYMEFNLSDEILLKFEVIDTGIGIPEEQIDNIFESFTQVEETHEKKYSGTGLGLAITKQLVEAMGGKITVNTKLNVGSTFSFFILFKEIKNYMSQEIMEKQNDEYILEDYYKYTKDKNIKILVAEDNQINQILMEKLININRWSCKIVQNGKEAIEILEKEDFDIILMDISMPVMNGIEAAKIIKNNKKWKNIPIIALTAHALIEDKEKFLGLGMSDYLSKPVDSKKLYFSILKNLNLLNDLKNFKAVDIEKKQDYSKIDKLQKLQRFENILDGDKKLVLELSEKLIHMFSEEQMKELADMANLNSFKELKERTHKLKGAVLNFELTSIYKRLNEIDVCIESAKPEKVNEFTRKILYEIKEFEEMLMLYKCDK
ncbi:ATP-binding protein [Clostridium sp. ZS2-4]|uniref:ATP-binding protein n=1 Tax=Clostridium sp. ZS2-4 TaxID=2987703 RepID=UPI00227CCE07|nr:ATP-binding protein [Clostridium sp. ZS2-4]MCY6354162.1 ATP-binding protein [Clostridium sp. ZS2-4]